MTELTYGSLFTGYAGLEEGVQSVLGGRTVWVSEFDADASRVLEHNYPDVPNLGDMTLIDWSTVEPVDVLTGGSPCQDLSHAGRRKGMNDGTRSNLWVTMREAIATLRPRLVVWENVRGAYSADADSGLEQCPRCVGDPRDGGSVLRALGRVLGDLSDLGYDAQWHGIRAADVGGAHGRFRVFVFATPRDADGAHVEGLWPRGVEVAHMADESRERGGPSADVEHVPGQLTLLPTPVADNSRGLPSSGTDFQSLPNAVCALLPTPSVADAMGGHATRSGARSDELLLPGVAKALATGQLLPTPRATDGSKGGPNQHGLSGDLMLPSAVHQLLPTPRAQNGEPRNQKIWERDSSQPQNLENALARAVQDWGPYEAAIHRCERVWGREAPAPTEAGPKGGQRLAPLFVEWMMGLPAGHVTNPAIWVGKKPAAARNAQLKILGNGVVPPQAAAATRLWLGQALPVIDHPTPLVPTPNPFHMGNTETPEEWRARRLDVFQRTGTRHGLPLPVFALSVVEGDPLTPDRYMPDEE